MLQTTARAALLAISAAAGIAQGTMAWAAEEPPHPAALDDAIIAAAKRHGVPESLVRRVIMRESKYNPKARNHKYWGLMQISYPTARSMGFKGSPQQLLDPIVNLRYAVPYLANAFICSGKRDHAAAVRLYAAGYYFTARTRGLLNALRTADSAPLNGVPDEPIQPILAANASAQPPESVGVFGAIFSPGREAQPQPATYSADASALQPRPVPAESTAAPAGTFKGATVAMEIGKTGEASPPKKWKRDGGVTTIGRGEQALERVAAHDMTQADEGRKSRRHARKFTLVASLDAPPSTAQAYAGQDPRFAATASQAAITQATSGAAPRVDAFGQPMAPEAAAQPDAAAAPAVKPTVAEEDKPKHRRSKRAHRRKEKSETQVAETKSEPAPDLRSTATQ